MATEAKRAWLGPVLKGAVSVGLLGLIARQVDPASLIAELATLPAAAWVAAIAALLLLTLLQGWRWWLVMRALGDGLPLGPALRLTLMSLLFNQALPGTLGGDAYRMLHARRHGVGWRQAVGGVAIDRVSGVLGLALIALAGLPAFAALDGDGALTVGVALVEGAILAGTAVLLLPRLIPSARMPGPLRGLRGLSADAWALARRPRMAALLLATSVVNHLAYLGLVVGLAAGLGLAVDAATLMVVMPPVLLIALMPVSIAGWGVREGAAVAGLALAGIGPAQALSLSLAIGLVQLFAGLVSGAAAEGWRWAGRVRPSPEPRRTEGP